MPVPIISVAQMRDWEKQTWAAKRTPFEVISRVGHIVTARARQLTRPGDSILVLAGKGHNGDDARQVVQYLNDREVTLVNVREPATALREFQSLLSLPQALIVEGIFGIGLQGPLGPEWCQLLEAINRAPAPILSVDVPAGLNADTGEPQGSAIRATLTLTLGAPKRGLLSPAALPYVGRLEVAPDIGLVPCPHHGDLLWSLPEDFQTRPAARPVDGHKGTFGHLVIFAGSLGYHGAAVLAARAAQRAQPGLVSLVVPPDVYVPVASQLQSVMVRPWHADYRLPHSCSAILVGPGLADAKLPADLKSRIIELWNGAPQTVIADASALDWLPAGSGTLPALRVITPHPGEAARLLQLPVASVQADRPGAVQALSRRCQDALVILKGHQTAIGAANSPVYINCSGNPQLAQGGAGDVLAGFLGGFLAQPAHRDDPLSSARHAVWLHGLAADLLSADHANWTVEDLVRQIGNRRPSR